jgi:hypothetical protein
MKQLLTHDYLKKNTNICEKINERLEKILTEKDINIIVDKIDGIQKRYLYKTNFHGYFHSQKVLLFAYLIAKSEKCTDEEMQILMDAAIYHDIGRQNEVEDEMHGYYSACMIEKLKNKILKTEIYRDKLNIEYLKSICDAHSVSDEKQEKIYKNYKYENENFNKERFTKLASILKDADALDRTRFKKTSNAVLQEKYLRYPYSRTLIKLAEEINYYYVIKEIEEIYPKFEQKYGYQEGTQTKEACLHGIGTDFFKLDSILDNGILSAYAQLKENIKSPRNFYGSNKELWISVVDANMISENGEAFNKYIKNNISLFCFVPKLKYEGDYIGNQADVNNKKEYSDEKYAFERIKLDQIYAIIIPNNIRYKKIVELKYLNCASKFDILVDVIRYYKEKIKEDGYNNIDETNVGLLLEEFYNIMYNFEMQDEATQKKTLMNYLNSLDMIKEKLNEEIQIWFNNYYAFILGKQDPTVNDVINYIISKHKNIETEPINDESLRETVIHITTKQKIK